MWGRNNCILALILVLLVITMIICIILLPTLEGITAVTAIFIPIIVRILDKGFQKEENKNGRKPDK